jgi:DNA-binding MarR family transcriptional regulator
VKRLKKKEADERPTGDDALPANLQLAAWVQFARTYNRLQRHMARMLEQNGLTGPQFDVLATLSRSPALSQQELTGRLLVAKGNVAVVCDHLEKLGLIERTADANDARRKRVRINAAGRELLLQIRPHHAHAVRQAWDGIDDKDLLCLISTLGAVRENLRRLSQD